MEPALGPAPDSSYSKKCDKLIYIPEDTGAEYIYITLSFYVRFIGAYL